MQYLNTDDILLKLEVMVQYETFKCKAKLS